MLRKRERIVAAVALAAACLLIASIARAELIERGDLFVKFDGHLPARAAPARKSADLGQGRRWDRKAGG